MPPRIYKNNNNRRMCEVCGKPLNNSNRGSLHTSLNYPECRTEYYRRRTEMERELRWEDKPNRRTEPCDVCGKPLRGDNKIGVCQRNNECRREYEKRLNKDSWKDKYQKRKPQLLEYMKQRNSSSKHEPLTYLIYSSGLNLWKIGWTTNIKIRFQAITNACPDAAIITTYPYGKELESSLHKTFAKQRIAKEWFKLSDRSIVDDAVTRFESLRGSRDDGKHSR